MQTESYDPNGLTDIDFDVAIIGMSGRFPGANNIDEYWQNLINGVESISFLSDEELRAAGVDEETINDPSYVKAAPILKRDPGEFDASFFGYSPREAQYMDPQHRLFLECAWEAMEHAGYDAQASTVPIGVYGGAAMNTYFMYSGLIPNFATEYLSTLIGNDNSFLTTRASYKLNLTGPSVTVQTACSTALVAVHMAYQSLLNMECDIALAGGVSVRVPHKAGYYHQEGSVASPDGHCRTFDKDAKGTLFGSGAGMIVLKRLREALEDGDTIYAVIKGSAINNDGSSKLDYTAPSVSSQSAVVAEALSSSGLTADSISYIEAHGTGTFLGDPIEIAALTTAFRNDTEKSGYCAIGSVKTNIGHLDAAAGIAGIIKTALALKHRQIPPSLHFEEANPQIDFENSPFYVNTELSPWIPPAGQRRRAGVTALGIGGTNAHVILEEAPAVRPSSDSRRYQLIPLSARSADALNTAADNLAQHLEENTDIPLADVAYTLQTGRKRFDHRRILVTDNREEALQLLRSNDRQRVLSTTQEPGKRDITFMFSGQGAQYANMGRDLYEQEPLFREIVDQCAGILRPHLSLDIRELLYPADDAVEQAAEQLKQTCYTQPALFTIEYALAQLWISWGIEPTSLVGHSIGEYVAACLAGVFSLEGALALVSERGRLMQSMPPGSMLAVIAPEEQVTPYLNGKLSLAVINGESVCVVAGEDEAVSALESQLAETEVKARRLRTSHAFHSPMMEPILDEFTAYVRRMAPQPPQRPFVSNVTGTWITPDEATDPTYWARHLRHTVRFYDCLETLLQTPNAILLEVGPGNTLASLARQHPAKEKAHTILASTRHIKEEIADDMHFLRTLGQLWMADVDIDWSRFYEAETRHRVPLPTYPFERQRHWYKPRQSAVGQTTTTIRRKTNIADWFYLPSWQRSTWAKTAAAATNWLLFVDQQGLAGQIAETVRQQGGRVTLVEPGDTFAQLDSHRYAIAPASREDYTTLLTTLAQNGTFPAKILHLWNINTGDERPAAETLSTGFYSLFALGQALAQQDQTDPVDLCVVANQLVDVLGDEPLDPLKAPLMGPVRVLPKELIQVSGRVVDIVFDAEQAPLLAEQIVAEAMASDPAQVVAYRRQHRWVQTFEPMPLEAVDEAPRLKKEGVYLITGGFGGLGATVASYLAEAYQARLILVGRSQIPPRSEWEHLLSAPEADEKAVAKIKQIETLEALGADVMPASADVGQRSQLEQVVKAAVARFGTIDGVIHTAGVVKDGLMQLKEPDTAAQVLAPKVQGTLNLAAVTADLALDFVVLFSSVNAILAPAGQADYSAANSFLDAFAQYQQNENNVYTLSVNWPGWQDVGLLARMPASQWQKEALAKGIAPQDGLEALKRALSGRWPQLVVSPIAFEPQPAAPAATTVIESTSAEAGAMAERVALPQDGRFETETEAKIALIWEDLLGVEQIQPDDHFFELGGSSLIALRMFAVVEKEFGQKLPLATLLEAPRLQELAAILHQTTESEDANDEKKEWVAPWRSLVKIQDDGSGRKPPLFLMHGAGGNILNYRDLARHLGSDQPVYGLQALGLNEDAKPHTTIEEMATHYLAEIQSVVPDGPYLLGGYCMGGTIALEIAQQLYKQGKNVTLLALLETYNWSNIEDESAYGDLRFYIEKARFHAQNALMLPNDKKRLFFGEKWAEAKRRGRMWLGQLTRSSKEDYQEAHALSAARLWQINDDAALAYHPHSYPGRIVHFVAKQEYSRYKGLERSWQPIAEAGTDICRLPMYPAGMLVEPFVSQLADELNRHINEALGVRDSNKVSAGTINL